MESELDLTPNQQGDIPTRIQRAKAFLHENPNEQAVTAACYWERGSIGSQSLVIMILGLRPSIYALICPICCLNECSVTPIST